MVQRNRFLIAIVCALISSCDSSGQTECVDLAFKAWQEQRVKDEIIIDKLQKLFDKDPNKLGSTIVDDSDYIQASPTAKTEIFRRLVAVNVNYIKANEYTQAAIEDRFGVTKIQISTQMESAKAAKSRIFNECKRLTSSK
jgi:hypothetical protein